MDPVARKSTPSTPRPPVFELRIFACGASHSDAWDEAVDTKNGELHYALLMRPTLFFGRLLMTG